MKETTVKTKTVWEKTKESFGTALMSAGIVLAVLLLLWIPFKVIPAIFGNGSNFVSTTLSSLFISGDATSTPSNTDTNTDTTNTPVKTNKPSTNYPVQIQPVYYGKSDLEITLLSTGINSITGQFTPTTYANSNSEISIMFQVKNIGTNVSGAWKLRINTPSRTTPSYDSPYQVSIKPGDRIIFKTSFTNPINTSNSATYITVDPQGMVDELSKNNNSLTVPLNITGTNYNYGNQYNSPNLDATCYANLQTSYVGSSVTWYATASGGNGYFSYSWSGSDSLFSNQSSVSQTYYNSGSKIATVTVTSNGQSVTKQCSAYIY